MNSAADALASIRARLEALEARAESRRAREQLADEVQVATVADPADVKARMVAEAVADLAAAELAPKPRRKARPDVAPEYRAEFETQESAAPVSNDDGGHSDATGTQPAADGVGAPTGTPEGSPEPELVKAAARAVKLPQARARGDWRERWDRINTNVLQAFLTMAAPIRGPFDGLEMRAGAGPP